MPDVFRTLCRLCDERVNYKAYTVYNDRFVHLRCARELAELTGHERKESSV